MMEKLSEIIKVIIRFTTVIKLWNDNKIIKMLVDIFIRIYLKIRKTE